MNKTEQLKAKLEKINSEEVGVKDVKKEQGNQLAKKSSIEKLKEIIIDYPATNYDPKKIMEALDDLFPKISSSAEKGNLDKGLEKQCEKLLAKAMTAYGLDTTYPLLRSVGEEYRPLAIEFNRQIIKEYGCNTASNKALAQAIVGSYIKILEYSQILHSCTSLDYISTEKTGFYAMISKELDRANRQFITALTTLKQLTTPSIEINVKTKTAFVAQNQQLNVNQNAKDKNENIKPK